MKRISVNKDDSYFENKHTFDDLVNKAKALGKSVIANGRQAIMVGGMIGCILLSANNIYKLGSDVFDVVSTYKSSANADDEVSSSNDEAINALNELSILATNVSSSVESKYHFENNQLLDRDGNAISLDGTTEPIFFISCNLNNETFENTQFASSKTKAIGLNFSAIDNNFVNYLPDTVEELCLNGCKYISNLDELPDRCPNISFLSINAIPTLSDLSFIYRLPNLKEVNISDSAYVTEELLNYLRNNNISTNIDEKDIANAKKIDDIIKNIITPDMSDDEKIQAVCLYVLNNVEYDITQTLESNRSPLSCVLEDGKGVCASYAYFTSVLLSKAGIESFEITNENHGWNAVKLDDKYYYVDTTNMDGSAFYNFLLDKLNISKFYMVDTDATIGSAMSAPNDKKTNIPLSLIEDIQKGRDNKTIFEKYGGYLGTLSVLLASFLSGAIVVAGPISLKYLIEEAPFLLRCIRIDYKDFYKENYEGKHR